MVAALALGSEGISMGTRFVATQEAPVHENVKKAIVNATELDTRLIMRGLRNTERVLNNAGVKRLLEIEREKGKDLFALRNDEPLGRGYTASILKYLGFEMDRFLIGLLQDITLT